MRQSKRAVEFAAASTPQTPAHADAISDTWMRLVLYLFLFVFVCIEDLESRIQNLEAPIPRIEFDFHRNMRMQQNSRWA